MNQNPTFKITAYFNRGSGSCTYTYRHRADESRTLARQLAKVDGVQQVAVTYYLRGPHGDPKWSLITYDRD